MFQNTETVRLEKGVPFRRGFKLHVRDTGFQRDTPLHCPPQTSLKGSFEQTSSIGNDREQQASLTKQLVKGAHITRRVRQMFDHVKSDHQMNRALLFLEIAQVPRHQL